MFSIYIFLRTEKVRFFSHKIQTTDKNNSKIPPRKSLTYFNHTPTYCTLYTKFENRATPTNSPHIKYINASLINFNTMTYCSVRYCK